MGKTDNMSYWNCDNYYLPLQVQIRDKTGKDMSTEGNVRVMTTHRLLEMKQKGEKIAMLTAYDFTSARIVDEAGIDVVLVGDSAANVMAGHETTIPITVDQMIYHAQSVTRAAKNPLIVVDMPFGSYQGNSAGIPVMGHLGLTPQSIHKFGTYAVRAKEDEEAERLLQDAVALENAGCFALVLEKIPAMLGKKVAETLKIPVIGIGAGKYVDGQVLVMHDMLGLTTKFSPRFLRRYADLHDISLKAFRQYIEDVKSCDFPNDSEQY